MEGQGPMLISDSFGGSIVIIINVIMGNIKSTEKKHLL